MLVFELLGSHFEDFCPLGVTRCTDGT